jgi:hypothetical protein
MEFEYSGVECQRRMPKRGMMGPCPASGHIPARRYIWLMGRHLARELYLRYLYLMVIEGNGPEGEPQCFARVRW